MKAGKNCGIIAVTLYMHDKCAYYSPQCGVGGNDVNKLTIVKDWMLDIRYWILHPAPGTQYHHHKESREFNILAPCFNLSNIQYPISRCIQHPARILSSLSPAFRSILCRQPILQSSYHIEGIFGLYRIPALALHYAYS